jgi:uncharacterized protein
MIVLGLTDIHGATDKLMKLAPEIKAADLVLLVGDITNFGRKAEMRDTIDWVKQYNRQCLTVPGNCDYPETEETMDQMETNLNGCRKEVREMVFAGLGASLETPFKATPFEVSEEILETQLSLSVEGFDKSHPLILVSHQPPFGTKADALNNGVHVGSKSVRNFIESWQPLVCFCGHIHEGQGIDSIGDTKVINPGPVFQGNYAYAEISDKVEILEIRSLS